jgi:hypothetical protein
MVTSLRSALTTCIALVVVGIEAHKTRGIGLTPAASDRYRPTMFSLAAMSVILFLSACAEAPTREPRASLPVHRNLASLAPTPCNMPNTGQAETPNVLNSPKSSSIDILKVECLRGVPPPQTTWSWAGASWEPPRVPEPDRTSTERARQETQDFQRRQRNGR